MSLTLYSYSDAWFSRSKGGRKGPPPETESFRTRQEKGKYLIPNDVGDHQKEQKKLLNANTLSEVYIELRL